MRTKTAEMKEKPSVLAELGLSADELALLAEQGFVSADHRGPGRLYYKLRFRVAQQQRVCNLGRNLDFVSRVRDELAALQEGSHWRRELGRLGRLARRQLRTVKRQLEPLLLQSGYAIHGLAVRRPRSTRYPSGDGSVAEYLQQGTVP